MSARTTMLVVAALASTVIATARAEPQARPSPSFLEIYKAYSSGNVNAVVDTLGTLESLQAIRGDLLDVMKKWQPGYWNPVTAMFLLEVSVAGFHTGWPDAPTVLDRARLMVQERPDAPGSRPRDDTFEILFHRSAVALLIGMLQSDTAERYIRQLDDRVSAQPARGRLVDPRIALANAVVQEVRSRPIGSTSMPSADRAARLPTVEIRAIALALTRFDVAAQHPDTLAEAIVRKGHLLHRLSRFDDAIAVLSSVDAATTDQYVMYWCWLFRGRAFEALGRTWEGEDAYRRAATIAPAAQSPAVALAALLVRQNRPEEAQDWAAKARLAPDNSVDPWWRYWSGDLRFLPEWVDELRKAGR